MLLRTGPIMGRRNHLNAWSWITGIKKVYRLRNTTYLAQAESCWFMLSHFQSSWVILVILDHVVSCWVVLSHVESCWVVLSLLESCSVKLSNVDSCWVMLIHVESCWFMLSHLMRNMAWLLLASSVYQEWHSTNLFTPTSRIALTIAWVASV